MNRNIGISVIITIFLAFIGLFILLAGTTKAPPGYVGILVDNYGSQRGVKDFPIHTGRIFYNPFTSDVYLFPTFLQNQVWTRDKNEGSPINQSVSFNSIEGSVINADIAISYRFEANKVPDIFVKFHESAKAITNGYIRSQVRKALNNEAGKMKAIDIIGKDKQKLMSKVMNDLESQLGPMGIHFNMVSFTGGFRMDPLVRQSINQVIQAAQRANQAEQKVRQAKAEAQQAVETAQGKAQAILDIATAQAKANRIVNASLTPNIIKYQAIQQWNGILPQVTGSGGVPLIDLHKLPKK